MTELDEDLRKIAQELTEDTFLTGTSIKEGGLLSKADVRRLGHVVGELDRMQRRILRGSALQGVITNLARALEDIRLEHKRAREEQEKSWFSPADLQTLTRCCSDLNTLWHRLPAGSAVLLEFQTTVDRLWALRRRGVEDE